MRNRSFSWSGAVAGLVGVALLAVALVLTVRPHTYWVPDDPAVVNNPSNRLLSCGSVLAPTGPQTAGGKDYCHDALGAREWSGQLAGGLGVILMTAGVVLARHRSRPRTPLIGAT